MGNTVKDPAIEGPKTEEKVKIRLPKTEEKVKIRLPIIPGAAKQEAQFVGCNTRTWVIPRGVEMEVPKCVVEILRNSERAQLEAMRYQEANAM